MPGRPKMMAKRVTELEERALALKVDVDALMPDQYVQGDYEPDSLAQAWQEAWAVVDDAVTALEWLGYLLRNKVGFRRDEDGALWNNEGFRVVIEPESVDLSSISRLYSTDATEPKASSGSKWSGKTSEALDGSGGDRDEDK